MSLNTEPTALKHLTYSTHTHVIATPKKDDALMTVFPVDSDYSFRLSDQREASGLIESRAGDMQPTIVSAFYSFESVERQIFPSYRLGDLGRTGLGPASVRCDDGGSRLSRDGSHTIVHAKALAFFEIREACIFVGYWSL